jgi:hypothetical protein
MKTSKKKILIYIVTFIYLTISISIPHFGEKLSGGYFLLNRIVIFLFIPGGFISFMFGFFGGTFWEIIGIIVTIILTILIIENYFKKHQKKDEHSVQ